MLSFDEQGKILGVVLQRETNKLCADCGSHSPTWASLDFGVFVCSNCSGAHRALGPTITRIKSTKLDQWNSLWLANMQIGNREINSFWEGDADAANLKKPKVGASLDEHNRYVVEKYVRRKFVIDKNRQDPLTAFKNGTQETLHKESPKSEPEKPNFADFEFPKVQLKTDSNKKMSENAAARNCNFDLLSDEIFATPNEKKMIKQNDICFHVTADNSGIAADEDDEFTDFVQVTQNNNIVTQQIQNAKEPSQMSFDDLLKGSTSQQSQQNQWNASQQNQYWQYGQQQWGQSSQHYSNQFMHNPYIGYAPHNQLHAAHNCPQPQGNTFGYF